MSETLQFEPMRIENQEGFLLAGLRRRYVLGRDINEILNGVGSQWLSFRPRKKDVPRPLSRDSYGVCLKIAEGDQSFEYFCGVKVRDASGLPPEFTTLALPPLRYAIFPYRGPSSMLPTAYLRIYGIYLPEADLLPADAASGAPEFIELFGPGYSTKTETGGPDIFIPLMD